MKFINSGLLLGWVWKFGSYYKFSNFTRYCSNTVKMKWKSLSCCIENFLKNLPVKEF